jgi:uncharacterized OsmC-like protein
MMTRRTGGEVSASDGPICQFPARTSVAPGFRPAACCAIAAGACAALNIDHRLPP